MRNDYVKLDFLTLKHKNFNSTKYDFKLKYDGLSRTHFPPSL